MGSVSLAMLGFATVASVAMFLAFRQSIKPKRRPPGFDGRVRQLGDDSAGE